MLSFPRLLKRIEGLNYANALKTMKLPTVVFVGDENAGKSSTLERIAMVDVLPRSNRICTRQPIKLKLRHKEGIPSKRPEIRLRIPGQDERSDLTAEEARAILERHMQELAKQGKGIVFGDEVEVEVRSNGVPTIDLIDLPGLIAVRVASEPESMAEMTKQCTNFYLSQETTGVVVCVLDATTDNLRTSTVLRLIQDAGNRLKNFTIGALTKADKTSDVNWRREGRRGPYWKTADRLSGVAEDCVDIGGGYVALLNRNTMDQQVLSLQGHNDRETEWFQEEEWQNMEKNRLKLQGRLGIMSLVAKMDEIICASLETSYAPRRWRELQESLGTYERRLEELGTPPEEMNLRRLLDHVEKTLERALSPTQADEIYMAGKRLWPSGEESGSTKCEQMGARMKLVDDFKQSLGRADYAEFVANEVAKRVRACFNEDSAKGYRLCRFTDLRDVVEQTVRDYVFAQEKTFNSEARNLLQNVAPALQNTSAIRDVLNNCIMCYLIVPVTTQFTGKLEWFKRVRKIIQEFPEEDCASLRARLNLNKTRIGYSMSALQLMWPSCRRQQLVGPAFLAIEAALKDVPGEFAKSLRSFMRQESAGPAFFAIETALKEAPNEVQKFAKSLFDRPFK